MFREVKDSDWSADHIARHGVTLREVREAILERPHATRPGREGTRLLYGRTYAGRYLFVVATRDTDDPSLAFIITARDMGAKEKKIFQREAR